MDPFVCDHGSVIKEMRQQQVLVTQLRALVLPSLRTAGRSELVAQLFEELLSCSATVISRLESRIGGGPIEFVDGKSRVRKNLDERMERLEEEDKPNYGHKRRRHEQPSSSLMTHVPHYDGHQWRKYGQKHINSAKYPRSYHRCTYSKEQRCPATKTIQQQENNCDAGDDPAKYTVVYYGHHTCEGENMVQLPSVVEANPQNDKTALTDLFMLPHVQEFAMDCDVAALLQAMLDVPVDSDNREMDVLLGFDQASSPVYVGAFNF